MRSVLALCVVCALASVASADTKALGKLSVTAPAGWKLAVKPAGITGESKDKEVALLAWSMDGTVDVAAAQKKLEGELYSAIASFKWDAPATGKVHDLAASYVGGQGHAVGGDVVVKSVVVGPDRENKSLLVVLAVNVAKLDAHKAEIQRILESVQVTK
ncbi:MAG TPA: hypothetical protein VGC41_05960 [Kofleriaceae bacterium]